MTTWAYLFEHRDADPHVDRQILHRAGQTTLLIPVSDPAQAAELVDGLIEDGVEFIELSGRFTAADAATVARRVAGRVPVGHVAFATHSILPAPHLPHLILGRRA